MPKSKNSKHVGCGSFLTIDKHILNTPKVEGFSWTFKHKESDIIADIYFLIANESLPVLLIADPKVHAAYIGPFKLLGYSVAASTKAGKKLSAPYSDITIASGDHVPTLLKTLLPSGFKTVVYTQGTSQEWSTWSMSFKHAKNIFCDQTTPSLLLVRNRYTPHSPPVLPLCDAKTRALVACKLSACLKQTGRQGEDRHNGDLASQVCTLKNKLAVLMANTITASAPSTVPVAPSVVTGGTANPSAPRNKHSQHPSLPAPVTESVKVRRFKMQLLGMLAEGGGAFTSSGGRALAATRWLDGTSGQLLGAPWKGEVRTGASVDSASLAVRTCVEAGRAIVEHCMAAKRRRLSTSQPKRKKQRLDGVKNDLGKDCSGLRPPSWDFPPWTPDDEWACLPRSVVKQLSRCNITATGWRPNPHCKDSDDWGGAYGKCCGHNEVVMHYIRPFAPMEVLNTLVCSGISPAPGNFLSESPHCRHEGGRKGFDGCLEFLQMQCRLHARNLTVWDTESMHFIANDGSHRAYPKAALLSFSKASLEVLIPNLRDITIETNGCQSPVELLRTLLFRMHVGTGAVSLDRRLQVSVTSRKGNPTVHNSVGSYLLRGNEKGWRQVCSEIIADRVWLS